MPELGADQSRVVFVPSFARVAGRVAEVKHAVIVTAVASLSASATTGIIVPIGAMSAVDDSSHLGERSLDLECAIGERVLDVIAEEIRAVLGKDIEDAVGEFADFRFGTSRAALFQEMP